MNNIIREPNRDFTICFRLLKLSILEHDELKRLENIDPTLRYICSNKIGSLSDENNRKRFSKILLHVNPNTFTGRFSKSYNKIFNHVFLTKNKRLIDEVLNYNNQQLFPEFYLNKLISKEEKDLINLLIETEYHSILNYIEEVINNKDININKIDFINCPENINVGNINDQYVINNNLYYYCYLNNVLYENNPRLFKYGSCTIPKEVFIISGDDLIKYDLMSLLNILSSSNLDNYKDIDQDILLKLSTKYSIEIKLLKYNHE